MKLLVINNHSDADFDVDVSGQHRHPPHPSGKVPAPDSARRIRSEVPPRTLPLAPLPDLLRPLPELPLLRTRTRRALRSRIRLNLPRGGARLRPGGGSALPRRPSWRPLRFAVLPCPALPAATTSRPPNRERGSTPVEERRFLRSRTERTRR